MKKLIIAFVVVVILVVGLFGSAVMAAPPSTSPTGIWDEILNAVEDIQTKVNNLGQGVSFVLTSVNQLHGKADNITISVDSLSETAIIMESDAGIFAATAANPDTVFNKTHDQIAHVTLTVYADWLTANDSAWVSLMWEDGSYEPAITVFDTGAGIYKGTVEFVAKEWALRCYDDDALMDVYWAYTATYPANSTE